MTLPRATAALLTLALAGFPSQAAFIDWIGGGADTNWSTNANWVLGAAPSNGPPLDDIQFLGGTLTSNVNTPWSVNSLTFSNGSWTLTGLPIIFLAGGSGTIDIQNFSQSIANTLVFDRAGRVPVIVANVAQTFLNVTGSGGFTKIGTGMLTVTNLTGTGSVEVSQGALIASPTSGSNAVIVSGVLDTNNSTWGPLSGNSGSVVLNGTVTFNQTTSTTFGSNGINGIIAGPGSLVKAGFALLTLAGNNSWAGTTTITEGTLNFNGGTFPNNGPVNLNGGNIGMATTAPANIGALAGGGLFTVNNGTVNQTGAWNGNFFFFVNGGTLNTTNMLSTGDVTMQGGVWNTGSATVGALAGNSAVTVSGTLTTGFNNNSTTFSGPLNFSGGPQTVFKAGLGTWTLANTLVQAGGTLQVQQGAIELNAANSASPIVIASGGTLSGTGAVTSIDVQSGGTLAPQSIVAGAVSGAGTHSYFINGTAANAFGHLTMGAAPVLTGATLALTGSYVPVIGDTFTLIDNQSASPVTGAFNGRAEGALITFNGVTMRLSYVGGTGNDVVLSVVTRTVTPSVAGNGSISPNTAQTVLQGGTTQFTLTPAANHHITNVTGTCGGGNLNVNVFTTSAITTDCTVIANFAINTYTVTPSAGSNGTISPNTPQTVNHGATPGFTVTPSAGYSAAVGGSCGGNLSGSTYTTNAIVANCTVAATFTLIPVPAVSLSATTLTFGGQSMATTSPAMNLTVTNTGGATLTVSSVSVNQPQFAQTNNCTSVAPAGTCTISVTFLPPVVPGAINSTAPVAATLSIASNAAGSPHAVTLGGTAEKSLVTHYYRSILRRAPDAGGMAHWQNEAARVVALTVNPNEAWYAMAQSFYFSGEYLALNRDNTGFITDLYNTFFNRPPDGGGLAFWLNNLNSGMPREVALAEFMFSAEFRNFAQAIFGNTAARAEVDAVTDFYRGLLARLPDDGGFAHWVGKFRTAQCVTPVSGRAAAITAEVEAISSAYALSPEYGARNRSAAQFVGDLYNAFLRRGGDLGGVQFWIGQVTSGARTRENVRVEFRNSAEFQARVNAIIAQGCL